MTARVAPRTVTSLPDRYGPVILTGKRTESVLVDSMGANTAQNVARQVLGRVPGLNVVETENAGFPSNGIGVRGLDPNQSVEMNVRQDGFTIAADPFGYAETYYVPPMEAVERVDIVRGAASLQYGPQFGGLVNYVMRRGDVSHLAHADVQQTFGSYGLHNTFGSLGGGAGRARWFGFVQRRGLDGWRPNSDVTQTSSHGSVELTVSPTLTARAEFSALRNRIHMPGGLTDAEFAAGAQQSFRARNWLTTPWNVGALTLDWRPSHAIQVQSVTSGIGSSRSLVWRNEDGGPGALDVIDPATGRFIPREVGREGFRAITEELRASVDHSLFGLSNTLSVGTRWSNGQMHRQGGGEGTTGNDFDLNLASGTYGYDIRFGTANVAAWGENVIRAGRLSVAPGFRFEHLRSTANGYTDTTFAPQLKTRAIPLGGLAIGYITSATTSAYANVTQAYRPMDYTSLTPIGSVSRVDPNMRDAHGTNLDLGWRGTLADDRVRFDVGAFALSYRDRVGLVTRTDAAGADFTVRTNVANSVHRGIEAYLEGTPIASASTGTLTAFTSTAILDAHYTTGEFRGNRVEYAPRSLVRGGVTYALGPASTTFLATSVSREFGDANNTMRSADAVVGVIPAYAVLDWSGRVSITRDIGVQAGVNNLTNRQYFTRRTDEYPGPGILPSIARSVYMTVRVTP
ncbi:MAG TPA: TonB-dependent receptor [Candidatus Elarobacter sp.]|nr:TonB-dependent receptor [Candidatus Elarobacter sp.]